MDKETFEFRNIRCPVCNRIDEKFVGFRGGEAHHQKLGVKTRIVRCLNCTHQYPNPMPFPVVSLDKIYVEPEVYFENHDLETKKINALAMMRSFENKLGRKGHLLDVGCGRGELLWAARECGWESTGIDLSLEFIEFGKTHLGVSGVNESLLDANFPSNHFDAIAMNGLIEHLYDPNEILTEVHRVLKPDGWLTLDSPNEDGLYMYVGNAYMRLRGKDWVVVMAPTFPPYHVQGFNPVSLRMLLEKQGLVIKSFKVHGEIYPQLGNQTFKKKIEFQLGRVASNIGNIIGKGSYMFVWAKKG